MGMCRLHHEKPPLTFQLSFPHWKHEHLWKTTVKASKRIIQRRGGEDYMAGVAEGALFSTPKTTGFMGALTCAAVHHCVRLCIAGCFLFACSLFTGKKSKVTEAQWSVCKCDSHLPLWHSGWKPCIQIVTTYFKITDVILLNERCNKKPSIGRSPFVKWLCVFRSVTALQQSWETMQRYW